jgi:DNA-binding NarL/FixJ family response regulator
VAGDPLDELESKLRVLVIEDDPVMLAKLHKVIENSGLAIVAADGLHSARERISSTRVDAAILDVHLPDGNGLTLVPELHGLSAPCACVALTADVSEETARRAIALGVTQLLRKPATAHQIQHAVSMAVHRSRLYRSWLELDTTQPADEPATARRPRTRPSSYRVSVAAEHASDAIEIAKEGLPRGATVTEQSTERDPDLDRWIVTLRFTKA